MYKLLQVGKYLVASIDTTLTKGFFSAAVKAQYDVRDRVQECGDTYSESLLTLFLVR
jgi:hypothetical protein